jgi:hypothetical protein
MPQFHRIYDSEKEYTVQELKAHLTMTESQADRLAAAILMLVCLCCAAAAEGAGSGKLMILLKNMKDKEDLAEVKLAVYRIGSEDGAGGWTLDSGFEGSDLFREREIAEIRTSDQKQVRAVFSRHRACLDKGGLVRSIRIQEHRKKCAALFDISIQTEFSLTRFHNNSF